MVTSRRRKRWVIPKGKVKQGLLPNASAAREAFEEAGAIGRISNVPLGIYRQSKVHDDGVIDLIRITAFAMEVSSVIPVWPEMRSRRRKWMTAGEAILKVRDRELRALLQTFVDQMAASPAHGHAGDEKG